MLLLIKDVHLNLCIYFRSIRGVVVYYVLPAHLFVAFVWEEIRANHTDKSECANGDRVTQKFVLSFFNTQSILKVLEDQSTQRLDQNEDRECFAFRLKFET